MKKLLLIFIVAMLLFGCSSSNDIKLNDNDYLIFGHFYGFCLGENCIELFKLTNDKLYEDTLDNYNGSPVNFEELSNEKFEQVKDLIDALPTILLTDTEEVFGCPDCADGGGLHIEYSKNGHIRRWRIDQVKANVPYFLHDFMDAVNEKISLINN